MDLKTSVYILLIICFVVLSCGCTTFSTHGTSFAKAPDEPDYASRVSLDSPRPLTDDRMDQDSIRPVYGTICRSGCREQEDLDLIFEEFYQMNYQNIGLFADMVEQPFIVQYFTTAKHESPHQSYLIITITDYDTEEIIIEEGFNRVYSSESPKEIILRKPGRYHINIHGAMTDVTVKMYAGG